MKKTVYGNSEATFINDNIKQQIIDYLYLKLDLSKFRYIILSTENKLKFLQDNEHYVSPNFKGYNYLLIMITINNIQYSIAIDRKKLSYHKSQLDMTTIQLILLDIKCSDCLFKGTIFDGKIIHNNKKYIFLIQDCYYLIGEKVIEIEMNQKMIKLDSIMTTYFNNNSYCSNFEFKLNKLYKYEHLETLINSLPTLSINASGLIFYPKFSGINILHLEKKTEKININTNNNEIIEQKSYNFITNPLLGKI